MKEMFKFGGFQGKTPADLLENLPQAYLTDLKKAEKILAQVLEHKDPNKKPLLEEFIRSMARQGKDQELALLGEQYHAWEYAQAETLNLLGNSARKVNRLERAEQYYTKAISLKPSFELPLYNIAATLGKVKLFDEQIVKLIAPFKKQRDFIYPDFRHEKDLLLEVQEYIMKTGSGQEPSEQEILAQLKKEVKMKYVQPMDSHKKMIYHKALYNLGLAALRFRDWELAYEILEKLDQQNCKLPFFQMLHACAMFNKGMKLEAIEAMTLLSEVEKNRYVMINLGQMYKRMSNSLLAFRYFIEGAKMLKKTDGLYEFGAILARLKEYQSTSKSDQAYDLLIAIQAETERAEILKMRVEILMGLKRYDEAMPLLAEMLDSLEERGYATNRLTELYSHYLNQAEIHYEQNKAVKSCQYYEKALKIKRLPEVLFKAAKAYKVQKNMGRYEELMEEYKYLQGQEDLLELQDQVNEYIAQGKQAFRDAEYEKAIAAFNKAYDMTLCKEAFSYLEKIYTFLNRKKALTAIQQDWNRKMKHQRLEEQAGAGYKKIPSLL